MPVYLQARLKLRYGTSPQFHEAMGALVPHVEQTGWKLVGSWQQLGGDIHEVLDLWELPDANALTGTLAALAAEPDVAPIMEKLSAVVIREELFLCAKTPFSP